MSRVLYIGRHLPDLQIATEGLPTFFWVICSKCKQPILIRAEQENLEGSSVFQISCPKCSDKVKFGLQIVSKPSDGEGDGYILQIVSAAKPRRPTN